MDDLSICMGGQVNSGTRKIWVIFRIYILTLITRFLNCGVWNALSISLFLVWQKVTLVKIFAVFSATFGILWRNVTCLCVSLLGFLCVCRSLGGLVLDHTIAQFEGIAAFQPVINGMYTLNYVH